MKRLVVSIAFALSFTTLIFAQNTNSSSTNSSTTKGRPRTTNSNTNSNRPRLHAQNFGDPKSTAAGNKEYRDGAWNLTPVLTSFNKILDGIRHANVDEVTAPYWNSRQLLLFNNNGTVTRGWDQMRKNRESSYPDLKDVKLDVRDVHVTMLGRDGAIVTCLWSQSQTYKGTPETASAASLVFKRVGTDWKVVHLHTSPGCAEPCARAAVRTNSNAVAQREILRSYWQSSYWLSQEWV